MNFIVSLYIPIMEYTQAKSFLPLPAFCVPEPFRMGQLFLYIATLSLMSNVFDYALYHGFHIY